MNELELIQKLLDAKHAKGFTFEVIANNVGGSTEFIAAAIYRQAALSESQARALVTFLGFPSTETAALIDDLQKLPVRGGLQPVIPTDPSVYALYEIVALYGLPIRALINEEFGDGVMSTTDFTFKVNRESSPTGDRIEIILDGKFEPFKKW